MKLSRYITEDAVKLEMTTDISPFNEENSLEKWHRESKQLVIDELVTLLESAYRIGNRTKLVSDFLNREKKASTGIGHGVAFPHIRSLQAKDFVIAFARSSVGYYFDSTDEQPAQLFFIMAAPPYDDALYLKAFKTLAGMLQYESFREELLSLQSPGEVLRAIRSME